MQNPAAYDVPGRYGAAAWVQLPEQCTSRLWLHHIQDVWHSFYHGCSASAEANDSLSVHQKVDLMSFDEIAYVPTFAVTAYLYVFA